MSLLRIHQNPTRNLEDHPTPTLELQGRARDQGMTDGVFDILRACGDAAGTGRGYGGGAAEAAAVRELRGRAGDQHPVARRIAMDSAESEKWYDN